MKNLFIVLIFSMGTFFILGVVFQILHHRKKKPVARYICSSCGENHCQCHDEKEPPMDGGTEAEPK